MRRKDLLGLQVRIRPEYYNKLQNHHVSDLADNDLGILIAYHPKSKLYAIGVPNGKCYTASCLQFSYHDSPSQEMLLTHSNHYVRLFTLGQLQGIPLPLESIDS